jgi:hypothetical protein
MASSQARIEANRRNGRLSRGPVTPEGRERSKMNAMKHGMASRQDTVPGEDLQEFVQRLDDWNDTLVPENPVEKHLVEHAVRASWKVDRVTRVQNQRLTSLIKNAARRELELVASLGERLVHNPQGPTALYGTERYDHKMPRISWSAIVDDCNEPAKLVQQLSATVSGCRWLLGELRKLHARLATGEVWQPQDTFRLTRLLGHQPLDSIDVRELAEVQVATWSINPHGENPYSALRTELDDREYQIFVTRVRERWTNMLDAGNPEEARRVLVSIVERAIETWEARTAELEQNAEADAVSGDDGLKFDASAEGEQLRRYELSSGRAMFRSLNELYKLRRAGQRAASMPRFAAKLVAQEQTGRTEDRGPNQAEKSVDDGLTTGTLPGQLGDEIPTGKMPGHLGDEMLTGKMPVPLNDEIPTGKMPVPLIVVTTDLTGAAGDGDTTGLLDHDASVPSADANIPIKLQNINNEPIAPDGHVAGLEPVLTTETFKSSTVDQSDHIPNLDIEPTEGDGHLARQHSVLVADAADGPTSDQRGQLQNLNNDPKPESMADLERHPTAASAWPLESGELKMTVLRELERREIEASRDARARARDRRGRSPAQMRVSRMPDLLEIPFKSPILQSLPPTSFSRLIDQVHHELEDELI